MKTKFQDRLILAIEKGYDMWNPVVSNIKTEDISLIIKLLKDLLEKKELEQKCYSIIYDDTFDNCNDFIPENKQDSYCFDTMFGEIYNQLKKEK